MNSISFQDLGIPRTMRLDLSQSETMWQAGPDLTEQLWTPTALCHLHSELHFPHLWPAYGPRSLTVTEKSRSWGLQHFSSSAGILTQIPSREELEPLMERSSLQPTQLITCIRGQDSTALHMKGLPVSLKHPVSGIGRRGQSDTQSR